MHQIRRKASGDTVCSRRCGFDVPVILRSSEETESILPPPEKQMVQVTNPFGLELTSGPASVTGKYISRNVEATSLYHGSSRASSSDRCVHAWFSSHLSSVSQKHSYWVMLLPLPSIPVLEDLWRRAASSSCLCSLLGVWLCVSVTDSFDCNI